MRFSVVVPTYHRPNALRACLESLLSQEFGTERFEIIVVDDGDDETTRGVVEEFSARVAVRYVARSSREGPAAVRNQGAELAIGEYLAFMDDDCEPEPGWLRSLDAAIRADEDPEAVVFGGRTVNRDPGNVYSTASQNLIDFLYAWYNADPHHSRFFATNNIAVSRRSFRAFGGFDVSFPRAAAEDRDFCDRWREKGGRLEYVPTAAVRHMNRLSLQTFIRQHAGYGRGAVYLHNARRRRGASLPRIEPIRFYRRLVFWPLGRGFGWRTPALLILAAVSQASYAFGYYTEQLRRRGKGTPATTGELAAGSMPSVQEKVVRP